jgi:hypothetical protein
MLRQSPVDYVDYDNDVDVDVDDDVDVDVDVDVDIRPLPRPLVYSACLKDMCRQFKNLTC